MVERPHNEGVILRENRLLPRREKGAGLLDDDEQFRNPVDEVGPAEHRDIDGRRGTPDATSRHQNQKPAGRNRQRRFRARAGRPHDSALRINVPSSDEHIGGDRSEDYRSPHKIVADKREQHGAETRRQPVSQKSAVRLMPFGTGKVRRLHRVRLSSAMMETRAQQTALTDVFTFRAGRRVAIFDFRGALLRTVSVSRGW